MNHTQPIAVSRRGFLVSSGLAGAGAVLGWPRTLLAEAKEGVVQMMRRTAADAKVTGEKLRDNLHVLIGSGGNIGVLSGPDGKLLVDAGMTGSRPQIVKALASISGEPIKHLINTHWHFDHTDGNEWLHEAGATIMAHENLKKRLSTPTRVEAWDFTFEPSPAGALPTEIVKTDRKLKVNGVSLAVEHYPPPCHTDTDVVVHFETADVLHTGDTFWNGHYPFIDYSTGGTIDGMINACKKNLARLTDKSIVIPGHGPVADKAALTKFTEILTDVREKVAAMKKAGKSLEEVTAAKPSAKYDEEWGTFVINPATFAALVYAGV
jgi:glyoxylase-like metal-dependent hydrolase (beta-lactamase superfamily II)